MKITTAFGLILTGLLLAMPARAQLTIELSVPASTPPDATVYVAGTFNGWDPGNSAYALADQGSDLWNITLPDSVRGSIEFKFTLGTWETVEMNAGGFDVPNRNYTVPATGADTYAGSVATWRNTDTWPLPNSTATPSVSIIDFHFEMPQLERTRRIWIYLPPDYSTTNKRYPVIYMQDGQNAFDAATSFAGEWEIDETLDALHAGGDWGAIVVAIANGEGNRSNEYHPWPSPQYGGGQGELYLDFVVDTLKPYIDTHYRTLTNRRNTGIGGSSSAGLISFYGAVHSADVFGRILAFSPAFFANPEIFDATLATTPLDPPTLFTFVSGQFETVGGLPVGTFADSQLEMVDTLDTVGYNIATDVRSLLPADGTHSEWFWRREFAAAYQWLFDNNDTDSDGWPDFADNCVAVSNPDQRDTDNDGFGNFCDADLNNDGLINFADLSLFGPLFFTADANADLNGDGIVNFADLAIVRSLFFGPPGHQLRNIVPEEKVDTNVSPNNPCPFLRALVQKELLSNDVASIGDLTDTIVRVANAGEGSPDLPTIPIRAIAVIANGLGPLSVAHNALSGVRLDELRDGPLDKHGAGSRILDSHALVDETELERLNEFASDKEAADGTSEPGLDAADLTRMMDVNFARAKGNRRAIDRKLMDGEWPVLLTVMGKEGKDGRYLSIAEVRSLFINRTLPERMMKKLGAEQLAMIPVAR